MKCPKCSYVTFDALQECKKCGAPLTGGEDASPGGGQVQEDLFSLTTSGAGEDEEETGREPAFTLPDMNVEYDPEEDEEDEQEEEGGAEDDGEYGPFGSSEEEDARTTIEDETFLPDEIWEEGAGFLPRLTAFAVDALVLAAVLSLFFLGALLALAAGGVDWSQIRSPRGIYAFSLPFYLLGLFLSLCYFTFFPGWTGRTPGKALLRLEIRRTDGAPMSYSRAFIRWTGYLVSFTAAGLGFFWILFDERRKGWHDYLSGTWVKDLRHEE